MPKITAQEKREALASEASRFGYTIEVIDLRSCFAHIRKGREVRHVAFWKSATLTMLRDCVGAATRNGARLDLIPTSRHFKPE